MELRRNRTINAYSAQRHSFTSPSDVWLSQHRLFTKHAHHSTDVLWTSRILIFFFKSDEKYRKYEHTFSEVRLTVKPFS